MRRLKKHEQRLLRKVNFLEWDREHGHREGLVMHRYRLVERDDYKKYSGLCRMTQKLVNILKQMDARDPFRIEMTDALLEKLGISSPFALFIISSSDEEGKWRRNASASYEILFRSMHAASFNLPKYNIGVITERKSLALCEKLSVSSFCRRRLATVMVKLKFAEHLKAAITYIEQGHIRVGPDTITDPAYLVTRNMEDFITWVDTSKIRRKVMEYNDKLDDYDAMN